MVVGAVLGAVGGDLVRAPADVERTTAELERLEPATSAQADKVDGPGPLSSGSDATEVEAVPASVWERPTDAPPVPSASPKVSVVGKARPVMSFDRVMRELEGKARGCARDAGLVEAPLEVQVLGDAGAIASVRVVDLGGRHPFTRCVDAVIRAAAPPLGGEPTRRYTFFARKK